MPFEFTIYTALYLMAVVVSALTAVLAYPSRAAAGGRWLFLMALAIIAWCAAEALDFSSTEMSWHLLAAQLSYLGATTAPVFFALFAIEYSGRWRTVPRRMVAGLLVVPAMTIVLGMTNRFHSLVWTSFTPYRDLPTVIIYGHGPAYWAITVYSLVLAAAAIVLIADTAVRSRGMFRTRSAIIIVAALAPWLMQLLYSLSPTSVVGLDPSLALSVTCALIVMAIARFRLLDLVPIPREVLVEEMIDGLVVLDPSRRVIELNPSAMRLLALPKAPPAGAPAPELFVNWGEAAAGGIAALEADGPSVIAGPCGRSIAVSRSRVGEGLSAGARELVILRDVSAEVRAESALQQANAALLERLDEIERLQAKLVEQATKDSLTGLRNRRYLDEELPRELARVDRGSHELCVVMFDVDHFKQINDDGGHAAGDESLIAIARMLESDTRAGDIVCRYGGDEFVVVMPETSPETAAARAEGWRALLRRTSSLLGVSALTISVGVAAYPLNGASAVDLLIAADHAVYASKAAGRDTVSVAPVPELDSRARA